MNATTSHHISANFVHSNGGNHGHRKDNFTLEPETEEWIEDFLVVVITINMFVKFVRNKVMYVALNCLHRMDENF